MRTVSVREFSYNPSAILAEVEQGETIQVTKHGKTIAVLSPPFEEMSTYDRLVAQGVIVEPPGGARTVEQMLGTFAAYKGTEVDQTRIDAWERRSARLDERKEELFRRIITGDDLSTLEDAFPDLADDEDIEK
ncbi:type II toxin-antitoxin system Phd/YefM family antitoxin [Nocardia sp. NPDC006044]|uniref:type II toxin-antitoxin system Phd/YefM family antitoxin n=1 Tax=Nocardia sp. NPDC006044 TaxID=3364306 RepID=UPI00368667C7